MTWCGFCWFRPPAIVMVSLIKSKPHDTPAAAGTNA